MPADLSPTARALRALEVLRGRPVTTAEELAARLGVTDRAARRYVAILREAGVEVISERGPYGGYRLGTGTRLPPVVFTRAEALALAMAVLDSPRSPSETGTGTGTGTDLVGSALDKVVRALPEDVGRQAQALREHASQASDRGAARPDPATTVALVDAVAAHRAVLIHYVGESGREWDGVVDPWAVVVRHGRWYLLCRSRRADAIRTYRVDRIGAVESTADRFEAPADLDAVALLEAHLGTGWEFQTRVAFALPRSEVAPFVRPPMGRLESVGDGCVLVGSTGNPAMYAGEWLAGLPFGFRVEGGPELRDAVSALAARLGRAVADPG